MTYEFRLMSSEFRIFKTPSLEGRLGWVLDEPEFELELELED